MKIPIHKLLDKLGLKDIVIKSPKDLGAFKKRLDELIKIEENKSKSKNK